MSESAASIAAAPVKNDRLTFMDTEMNCPQCNARMQEGELELKAWGIGLAPQAQLHFDGDLLLKDQYFPLAGFLRKGTTADAYRCQSCQLVCFRYADLNSIIPGR